MTERSALARLSEAEATISAQADCIRYLLAALDVERAHYYQRRLAQRRLSRIRCRERAHG